MTSDPHKIMTPERLASFSLGGDRWFFSSRDTHFGVIEARIAFDAAPVALALCDLAGCIVQANRAFQKLLCAASLSSLERADIAACCAEYAELDFIDELARGGVFMQRELKWREQRDVACSVMCTAQRINGEEETPRWLLFTFAALPASKTELAAASGDWSEAERLAGDGYWRLEVDAAIDSMSNPMTWSRGMYALMGVESKLGPITSRQWFAAIAPADRPRVAGALHQLFRNGGEYDLVYHTTRLETGQRAIRSRARRTKVNGAACVIVGVEQEISTPPERGTDERQFAFLRAIADNSGARVVAVDRGMNIVFANSAFRTLFNGRTVDHIDSEALAVCLPIEAQRRSVLDNLRRAMRGQRCAETVEVCVNAGARCRYDFTYSPAYGPEGSPIGAVASGVELPARIDSLQGAAVATGLPRTVEGNEPC